MLDRIKGLVKPSTKAPDAGANATNPTPTVATTASTSTAPATAVPVVDSTLQTSALSAAALTALASGNAEWVNVLLEKLWPNVGPAVKKMVYDIVPPMVDAMKPKWMEGVEITTFDLGSQPPKVHGIKVVKTDDDQLIDINLEMELEFKSNAEISLEVKPLPAKMQCLPGPLARGLQDMATIVAGIQNLEFKGTVIISLLPLIDEVPVAGALQVCFRELPTVDFHLTFTSSQSGILNYLKPFIHTVMKGIFAGFTLPEHICVKLNPDVPDICKPEGILLAELIEAKGVPRVDWFSKTDPFIEAFVRPRYRLKTAVMNGATPVFDASYEFLVHSRHYQKLTLLLQDDDAMGAEIIGFATVALSKLTPGQEVDTWLDVYTQVDEGGDVVPDCKIHVKLNYLSSKEPSTAEYMSKLDLSSAEAVAVAHKVAPPTISPLLGSGIIKVLGNVITAPDEKGLPVTVRVKVGEMVLVAGTVAKPKDTLTVPFGGAALFDVTSDKNLNHGQDPITIELAKTAKGVAVATFSVPFAEVRNKVSKFPFKGCHGGAFNFSNNGYSAVFDLWWFSAL